MTIKVFESYEAVRAAAGDAAAPSSRKGKVRCTHCTGWVAWNEYDGVYHEGRCWRGRDLVALLQLIRKGRGAKS